MRVALAAVCLGAVCVGAAPASATPKALADVDCSQIGVDDGPVDSTSPSTPFDLIDMPEAWARLARRGETPGAGVRVAVVDSGVAAGAQVPVVERVSFSLGGVEAELGDYHGTAVAGLVAGPRRTAAPEPLPVGFAPGAEVVDVRVYDSAEPGEGQVGVETPRVAAGLRWVADNAERLDIGVVTVALVVGPSRQLEEAIRAVLDADVVVVAGSGNRPVEGQPLFDELGELRTGEDAAGLVFPAGYDGVLAVSATAGGAPGAEADPRSSILQSSAIDVAAPTYGAVTAGVNGGTCVLPSIATSWAAAEVAGVVAVLRAAYPRQSARQVVSRLVQTADGAPLVPDNLTGAGVVQPDEALSRPLQPAASGEVATNAEEPDRNPRAQAPVPPEDRLAETRRNAVWLGLIGGAALAIAALLRPLLARRRSGL
ncbi:S8 family serine peptidase [Nocardioides bigeumensis]|uniref:Type VII secretion system ESX-3 serine protease mycosin MycP3 n=1 Tax=Nocardioides bigeumensis TaxID=433657 RepID=A0ABN2YTJ5_9ACTN